MDEPLRVRGGIVIPAGDLTWRFSRSSGPGGQSVNTADSRVDLRIDLRRARGIPAAARARALERLAGRFPDGVAVVVAAEHRSQLRNREAARERMAELLTRAMAPPPRPRRATRPTTGSIERRLRVKKRRGDVKRSRDGRGWPD